MIGQAVGAEGMRALLTVLKELWKKGEKSRHSYNWQVTTVGSPSKAEGLVSGGGKLDPAPRGSDDLALGLGGAGDGHGEGEEGSWRGGRGREHLGCSRGRSSASAAVSRTDFPSEDILSTEEAAAAALLSHFYWE